MVLLTDADNAGELDRAVPVDATTARTHHDVNTAQEMTPNTKGRSSGGWQPAW